jgi:hypothetical protein
MLNYLATSSSAFMILMIFSLLLFMAFSSLGVPLASKNECHPRECNSCNQNANTQIMLLYSCRSQPNTQELKRKRKKKKKNCLPGRIPPVNSHSHNIFSLFLYGVWKKHMRAIVHITACDFFRPLQFIYKVTTHFWEWNDKTTTTPILFSFRLSTTPSGGHHPCVGTLS